MKKLLPILAIGAGGAALMMAAGGRKRSPKREEKPPEQPPEQLPERKAVVYVFEADWCPHCKKAKRALEEVAKGHPEIPFQFLDYDTESGLANLHSVTHLPTVIAIVDGKVVRRIEGAGTVETYGEMATDVVRMASGAIPLPAAAPEVTRLPLPSGAE